MAGWASLENLIAEEQKQLIEEGVEPGAAEQASQEAARRLKSGDDETSIWAAFANLPTRADFGFVEPSGLAEIRAARSGPTITLEVDHSEDVLYDKMLGAWLGRCAGCALGKPVETGGFMGAKDGILPWQRMKQYLTAIAPEEWPLTDYFPEHSPAENETGKLVCPHSTRDHIAFMETDDDIRYTVLGQKILLEHGREFTSSHVANAWLMSLSYSQVCTAETQAYRNIVMTEDQLRWRLTTARSAELDAKVDWRFVANHLNPYREWIGAQIRVDSYGYAAPGNPDLAAEFAWRDARISHVKNGIYGAMFCAAMIAASFGTSDPKEIVELGLAQIPSTSRLHREMNRVIDLCAEHNNDFEQFEQVLTELDVLLGHYHPVHANNNAGLCVAALLLSGGDFHRGITLAVMGGWDPDCNGATVGSIVGAIAGAARVPDHWALRLNDMLNAQIPGYHPIAITKCAQRSVEIVKKIGT